MKRLLLGAAVAYSALGLTVYAKLPKSDGCPAYVPASGTLIAHAGGGLPDRTYANNLAAIDLAAKHGFKLIEMDLRERSGTVTLGHDEPTDLTLAELRSWMNRHPQVQIVTDFKTDNLAGLALLKRLAGTSRFIPQIYEPSEYAPVVAMGYPAPIFTAYHSEDYGWQDAVNALPVRAVAVPYDRRQIAAGIRHPLLTHFVNDPERVVPGFGIYTDCFIPMR